MGGGCEGRDAEGSCGGVMIERGSKGELEGKMVRFGEGLGSGY